MNTKNWHFQIRSEVDLRSIKTKILHQWFGMPAIGTFRTLAKKCAEEWGIDPQDAATDVERILKRNATQSMLKPRHVDIAKELYKNGYGAGAIAKILGEIESFKIGIDVVQENPEIMAWKKEVTLPNPQDTTNKWKTAEIAEGEIRLVNTDGKGGKTQYAKLPIQQGSVEVLGSKHEEMPVTQRDRLIGNLYQAYMNPTQIAQIMTELTGTDYSQEKVANILHKRIRGKIEGWQSHEFGLFKRAEFQSLRWRITIDKVIIYEATLPATGEGEATWIATVSRESGDLKWYRDPLKSRVDRPVLERTIASLYGCGVAPKLIPAIITKVHGITVTSTQVRFSIQRAKTQEGLQLQKKGHFHATKNQKIHFEVDGDFILIKNRALKSPENVKAKIAVKTGQITWVQEEKLKEMLDPATTDALIARLYDAGANSAKIANAVRVAGKCKCTIDQVKSSLDRLAKDGIVQRLGPGESNTAERKATRARVQDNHVTVVRKTDAHHEEVLDQFDLADLAPPAGDDPKEQQDQQESTPARRWEDKLLETYVRIRWHTDPRVGIAGEIGQELGIPKEEVYRIVSQQNAWGVLKPAHVYLIRKLHNVRVSSAEIGRAIEKIEGITPSWTPIDAKIRWLEEKGLVPARTPDRKNRAVVKKDTIEVVNGRRVIARIPIAGSQDAIELGLGDFYGQAPPTAQQMQQVRILAESTQDTLEQIMQEIGLAKTSIQAILLYGAYHGNVEAYETRFCTTPDHTFLERLVVLTKQTEHTLTEIAAQCECSSGYATKYILQEVYNGNEQLYRARFNPPPLTPEQVETANNLARVERVKDPADRTSFASIVREVGGTYEAVRAAVVGDTYDNDEAAFASDYPGGRHDLSPQQTRDIIREVTATEDSVYVIARRLGLGEAAVSRVALVEVYAHDYERYAARFPEKRVDEAAVAAATEHIRDPASPHRTYKAIAHAVSAEVAPISPASVMILARHLLTKAERAERFKGDPDYHIGQVTHVVAEGLCKRAAEGQGVAAYSETRLPRHHRKHDGPAPTDRKRRWVKADLILRLKDGQAAALLGQAGAEGVPLGEEAGWSPEMIAGTREILFEFGADQTPASVQRKDAKYAADKHGRPKEGRLVCHVATADWWGEGRVQADPANLANARVANLGFVADLLQVPQHEREALAEMARNNRARDQAAQERLAEQEGLHYCDDTLKYYADQGKKVPDWRGPQQTLDVPIEAAQEAVIGKGIDPARLAEAREFARAIREAQDADAAREKETEKQKEKKGLDPARLAEAREYAKAIQEARGVDAAKDKNKDKRGIDPARLAEAREYAKAIQEARDADKARVDQSPDPGPGAVRERGRERPPHGSPESSAF